MAPQTVHPLGNTLLRTPETFEKYSNREKTEGCPLCPEKNAPGPFYNLFYNWRLIPNDYPYDAVADHHDMLVPTRHVANFIDLNPAELKELESIRRHLGLSSYDAILENLTRGRTILGHYHLHLIQWKREQST